MIAGVVTANREAVMPVTVRNSQGHDVTVDAVIDTGFTGFLTLPALLVAWQARRLVQLDRQLREVKTAAVQGVFGHYLDPKVLEHLVESANFVDRLGVRV